jgi:hypothetical protein
MDRRTIRAPAVIALVWLWALPCLGEPTAQAVKLARRRFLEGVAAVDLGKYEAARLAFQQAYALKPHPSILRNLGQAEFQVGRYLEAARHLSTFLRDTTFGAGDERAAAQRTLAQAEAKVGRLVVEVAEGAEVSVDGELVGHAPLGNDPFYVEPGQRTVRIRRDGYIPYEGVHTFEGGRTTDLRIDLKLAPVEPLGATALDQPFANSEPSGAPPIASARVAPTTGNAAPTDQALPGSTTIADPPRSSHSGLVIALATTGGLTVVSAGVWLGFVLEGASLQRQEDHLKPQIQGSCSQAEAVDPLCAELHDVSQRRATANQVAAIGAVAAGFSAAGFVASLLFWPRSATGAVGAMRVLPRVGANGTGVDFVGVFE